jgi:putative ABC transport system substrate-binding protein
VSIEYRWAEGRYDRLPALAADLAGRGVAVIHPTGGLFVAAAAKAATSAIPIVFQGGGEDPVKTGLVASLRRPGGNVTEIMNLTGLTLAPKQIEFLRKLLPNVSSVGLLVNRANPSAEAFITEIEKAARALHLETLVVHASTEPELVAGFATMARQRIGALVVIADVFFTNRRMLIALLAARHGIPASYPFRDFVIAGGLISYGTDLRETNRLAGQYVGRILKGEKPADLPVQQATKIEIAINLNTAKALGLTIPETLLATADEVIQ